MNRILATLANLLISLWFPHQCMCCAREGSPLCDACRSMLPDGIQLWCPICGKLDRNTQSEMDQTEASHLHNNFALLPYQNDWISRAIHRMKYDGIFSYAETLGTVLAERWEKYDATELIISSIPVHRTKLLDRGYNQSEVMAKAFAKETGISYQPLLKRTRKTIPQFQNSAEERMQNMQDAFTLLDQTKLVASGKTVILIDDVITTGATLAEASKILYSSGATNVVCVAAAYSEKLK